MNYTHTKVSWPNWKSGIILWIFSPIIFPAAFIMFSNRKLLASIIVSGIMVSLGLLLKHFI